MTRVSMRFLSICSGIEAVSCALERLPAPSAALEVTVEECVEKRLHDQVACHGEREADEDGDEYLLRLLSSRRVHRGSEVEQSCVSKDDRRERDGHHDEKVDDVLYQLTKRADGT